MKLLKHLVIFCLSSTTLAENLFTNLFERNAFIRNYENTDNPLRDDRLSNSDHINNNNNRHLNTGNLRPYNNDKGIINDRNTRERGEVSSPYDRTDNQGQISSNQGFTNQNVYNTERNNVPKPDNNQNVHEVRNNNNHRNLNNQYGTNDNVYRNGVTEGYNNQRSNTNTPNVGTDRIEINRNLNNQRNTNFLNNGNNGGTEGVNYNRNINDQVSNLNNQNINLQNGLKGGFTNNNPNNERNINTNNEQGKTKNINNVYNENIPNDLSNMTTTESGVWTKISRGIQKEIRDIKHPVEQGITSIASSQCSSVKKLVGVAYEQIEGEKEPDLTQLALTFRTRAIQITYNITTAARLIPEAHNYNPKKKLYIFVHGFTDDPYENSFGNISEALLKQGECNVLALDGSSLIHWLYLRSTTYVRFMGEKLGEVLAAMFKDGVDPSSIHVIGHSLGAHISGFTGKTFQGLTGRKLGRISGLDPAGPCFSHIDEDLRLHATDAEFVDAMHTDAGVFGIKDPVGQVDYYPNEGYQQPNCVFQTCSHSRAWLYYAESVANPDSFPAVKCADWNAFKKGQCGEVSYMGFPSKPGTVGTFYLQTGEDSPYGKGGNGTKFIDDEGVVKKISGLIG